MKTINKLLMAAVLAVLAGFNAQAQQKQEPRQTETEEKQTQPTAQEYEAEEETSEDALPEEKGLETETEGTYDAETENVPTMDTDTYRPEAGNDELIEEDDTVGPAALQAQDFSTYDADNDGRIDEEEFKAVYTHNYSAWDTNQDGVLDEGEFKTGQGAVADQQEVTDQEGVASRKGVAGQYEDDSKLAAEKPGETEEFVSSVFEAIDEDSDGYIDEREFLAWTGRQGK